MVSKIKGGLPVIPVPASYILIACLSLCYANSFDGTFAFDDSEAIVHNDDVQSTPLWDLFKNDFWGTKLSHKQSHKSYRPFTILTFRLQYWIRQELIPQDFHIVNIALHMLVSVLLLPVFHVLLGSKGKEIGFYAAALFAVHPVHAEAVSGIVGRTELLCALFTWFSFLLYSYTVHTGRLLTAYCSLSGCILSVAAAMLCKETGITAIGVCVLYDIVIVNRIYPQDILTLLHPGGYFINLRRFGYRKKTLVFRLLILSLAAMVLLSIRFSVMGFKAPTFQRVDNPASFLENLFLRMINYSYIYCLNVWVLICPEWLCFDWSMGCIPLITQFDIRILTVFIFWLILGVTLIRMINAPKNSHLRYCTMGFTLLLVPFLPASNIFFSVGFVLAERILYIPSAGSDEWRSETSLFRSALRVCPLNAKVHYNIAKNAADAGNSSLARFEYEEALRLNPEYAQAMNNLGNLLKDKGKYLEAEKLFKRALELQDDFATAWMNLGIVLSTLKKYDDSEKSYLKALSYRPKYPDCYYNLGVLYLEKKEYNKALKAWEVAIKQQNNHRRAWTNMILLLDDLDRRPHALKAANEALIFLPHEASIYFNIANILGKDGRFLDAEIYFKKAIHRNPLDPMFYTNLGVLYHRWNRPADAERMYKKALVIKPDLLSARENLKKLHSSRLSIK